MKSLVILSIAAVAALGYTGCAYAAMSEETLIVEHAPPVEIEPGAHPYHVCHGRTSGTAHAACGTATGGPAGGLF